MIDGPARAVGAKGVDSCPFGTKPVDGQYCAAAVERLPPTPAYVAVPSPPGCRVSEGTGLTAGGDQVVCEEVDAEGTEVVLVTMVHKPGSVTLYGDGSTNGHKQESVSTSYPRGKWGVEFGAPHRDLPYPHTARVQGSVLSAFAWNRALSSSEIALVERFTACRIPTTLWTLYSSYPHTPSAPAPVKYRWCQDNRNP